MNDDRKAYQKQYREEHREEFRAYGRAYYHAHKEKLAQQHREWLQKNSEYCKAYQKARHAEKAMRKAEEKLRYWTQRAQELKGKADV